MGDISAEPDSLYRKARPIRGRDPVLPVGEWIARTSKASTASPAACSPPSKRPCAWDVNQRYESVPRQRRSRVDLRKAGPV